MDFKKAQKYSDEAHTRKQAIMLAKAHDYATGQDVLSNFKVMAAIQSVLKVHGYNLDTSKAWGVALWHLLHKFIRLLNLYGNNKAPHNESVIDTHDDLENYSQRAAQAYIDEYNMNPFY